MTPMTAKQPSLADYRSRRRPPRLHRCNRLYLPGRRSLFTLFQFRLSSASSSSTLSSHNPSESDLAQFSGLKQSSKQIDSNEIRNIDGFEFRRGDILPIRSLRNLHELEKPSSKSRSQRRIEERARAVENDLSEEAGKSSGEELAAQTTTDLGDFGVT